MKKINILLTSLMLLCPFKVGAYSDYVVVGGENIGIKLKGDGVLVSGFYKVKGKYNYNELSVGDYITYVNGIEVNSIEEFSKLIKNEDKVKLVVNRDGKELSFDFDIVDGKSGLYLKDSITGIGTVTYVDPETKIFGALGHEIVDSVTKENFQVSEGTIFKSDVTSVDRSFNGNPGSKNAKFYYDDKYGEILKNSECGVYGNYNDGINDELIKIGKSNEIKLGKAKILTVIDDSGVKEYEINITKINTQNKYKNIYFEIVDKELINKTGGIVQGMSGTPIIQDNKLIGAVTHVVIDDVRSGYGVFITTMLSEGEK